MKNINIEYRKVGELLPYERNPRRNDEAVELVANSIREFGFKVPIIVDSNFVVVTGHTRLKAAKRLGIDEVPVIIADDLTDEQVRMFRLADNKVSEFATWDFSMLEDELESIEFDVADFGFINTENVDIDGFFADNTAKESSSPKADDLDEEIQCPHCKLYFKVNTSRK